MGSKITTPGFTLLISRLSAVAALCSSLILLLSLGDFSHDGDGSPGCGNVHDFVGKTRRFSIYSNSRVREFYVHLPENYHADIATPVIVAYHGIGGSPEAMEGVTQLSDPLVNPNMITIYPFGLSKQWMGPNYTDPDIDDLEFTGDLVHTVMQRYCVDPSRVYAMGHSGGAGFVSQIACSEYPGGLFAAFAPMSPSIYKDLVDDHDCEFLSRRRPIFIIHGTGDAVALYEGGMGPGGVIPDIRDWVNRWLGRNHCDLEPQVTYLPNNVRDEFYTCDGRYGLVRHLVMEGQGHAYPDKGHLKEIPSPVDASTLVVQFFEQHSGD